MSQWEIARFQRDRALQVRTLLKYGHESDLPGFSEINRENPEELSVWLANYINAPLVEDLRPQLLAVIDEIERERGNGQRE